ncbi:MAG: ABC transporter substrate-binding protein, partial [Alphaproteobacteria bacterium]|nr:ABC transporter substrate-binding protein [Alphaproteobacteria bacterium]
HMGQMIRKAIDFAIEDVNKNPDNRFVYHAVFEDNQMQTRLTVPIANKMISRHRVSAMVTLFSANAYATAPVLVRNQIIGLHGTGVIGARDGVYNFTLQPASTEFIRSISEFAKSRNFERVALSIQPAGTTIELLEGLHGNLPGEVRRFDSNDGDRDFAMMVRGINEFQPDLIFVGINPPALNIFGREMHLQRVGATQLHFGLVGLTDDFSLFEGAYSVDVSQGNDEFIERIGSSVTFFSPLFYDGIVVFAKAVETAASDSDAIPSAEDISAAMKRIRRHEGVAGHIDITDHGAFLSSAVLHRIENNRPVLVSY